MPLFTFAKRSNRPSEADLLEWLRSPDKSRQNEAINWLVPDFQNAVRQIGHQFQHLNNRHTRKDILSESLYIFLRNIKEQSAPGVYVFKLRTGKTLAGYFYGICKNKFGEANRKQLRELRSRENFDPTSLTEISQEARDQIKAVVHELLRRALLTDDEQRIILLKYNGLNYPEIAEDMERPYGTCRNYGVSAMKKLKTFLDQNPGARGLLRDLLN